MHKINGVKTIGIIGGGQLARMMIPEIKKLGLNVAVLDPAPDSPCHSISDHHITENFDTVDGYKKLVSLCDVITYDFEHVDIDLLQVLETEGIRVLPSVRSLRTIQDKLIQKQALQKAGIAVPEFSMLKGIKEIKKYPFMLKGRSGGYDGKGTYLVKTEADIIPALQSMQGDLMMEYAVDFNKEVSVIATRGQTGECVIYPIAENIYKDNILHITTVPANLSPETAKLVIDTTKRVMDCFKGVGTFCVELFVNEETNKVLVNDVAPRVHNSGHYTIEACRTNQFENHVRAILGLSLGSTEMTVPCAGMKNIIGGRAEKGIAVYTGIENALKLPNVSVHIYGKGKVSPGRKMGHVTITGKTADEVKEKLDQINIKAVHLLDGN